MEKKGKESNPKITVIATSYEINEALELYEKGADYVIVPHLLGGERAAEIVNNSDNLNRLTLARVKHIIELKRRKLDNIAHLLAHIHNKEERN